MFFILIPAHHEKIPILIKSCYGYCLFVLPHVML